MVEASKKELADMFGCATTTIDAHRKKGMPTVGEGRATRYNIKECFKWLTAYTVQQEREKWDTTPTGLTEQEAKVRKLTAEALKAELELSKERGVVVNVSDSEREMLKRMTMIRSHLLSFPVRTAPFAVMLTDETTAREVLEKEIFNLMDVLAGPITIEEDNDSEDNDSEDNDSEDNDSGDVESLAEEVNDPSE
jgi:phage terminase Nu1 subunit (DNA packaging protein)